MDLLYYNGLYGSEKTNVNPIAALVKESLGCQLIILELFDSIDKRKNMGNNSLHIKTAGGKAKKMI